MKLFQVRKFAWSCLLLLISVLLSVPVEAQVTPPAAGETSPTQELPTAVDDSQATSIPASPAPRDPHKVYELTFDDLAFEMEKGTAFKRELLTPKINELDGATIKLRGYIKPAFTQNGLTKFIFVRDNQECCFGPTAALFDNVLVKLADGVKTDYTVRPVTLEGQLYLREYKGPDGNVWSIYRMKNGIVK